MLAARGVFSLCNEALVIRPFALKLQYLSHDVCVRVGSNGKIMASAPGATTGVVREGLESARDDNGNVKKCRNGRRQG